MPRRDVPATACYAQSSANGKLFAPSAARNVGPLAGLLARVAPPKGRALELASGTGQHVIAYAPACPGLTWQPTEIDPVRRASVDAYAAESGLPNIARAMLLDATAPGWSHQLDGQNLITLGNLLHLISIPEAQTLISQAANALAPGGTFVIYGPFSRSGQLISAADQQFHCQLTDQDKEIGYKDDSTLKTWLNDAGLILTEVVEMPANNLAMIAQKAT